MFNIFVRSMLGPWGQKLLDFYIANSLWINGLILLYFLLLFLSRWSYRRSLIAILAGIKALYLQEQQKYSVRELKARLNAADITLWQDGLRATPWPLIAGPHDLIPRLKTAQALRRLFPPDDLVELFNPDAPSPAENKQAH